MRITGSLAPEESLRNIGVEEVRACFQTPKYGEYGPRSYLYKEGLSELVLSGCPFRLCGGEFSRTPEELARRVHPGTCGYKSMSRCAHSLPASSAPARMRLRLWQAHPLVSTRLPARWISARDEKLFSVSLSSPRWDISGLRSNHGVRKSNS